MGINMLLLCVLFFATSTAKAADDRNTNLRRAASGDCVLPAYPEHGGYSVIDVPITAPGQHLNNAILNFACNPGFNLQGRSSVFCVNGVWSDDIPNCVSNECGTVTPLGEQLQSGVRPVNHGEMPWHAVIYTKQKTPYEHICGGSLVTKTVVISVGHCFWRNGLQPASDYAVAVGKIYRSWDHAIDANVQKSDVTEIKIQKGFHGEVTRYQDDIALVILSTPVQYNAFVKPVCLDFNVEFDKKQLQEGNMGKVPSWGLTYDVNLTASTVLKVVDLPNVGAEKCFIDSPQPFRVFITNDKICAGYINGTAVCRGDTGNGLVFPTSDRGTLRYYIRGVVSSASPSEEGCSNAYPLFTQITKHEKFIKDNVL